MRRQNDRALLRHPALTWDGWAISRRLARALLARLDEVRPERILELGSGTSTAVLAAWAAEHGAALTALEHDPRFLGRTRRLLEALGLASGVRLERAPCQRQSFGDAGELPAYRADPGRGGDPSWGDGPYDFAFVDGPPLSVGRQGALFLVEPRLSEDWEVWLKDGDRDHERECVALWRRHLGIEARLTRHDPRGVWVLTPGSGVSSDRRERRVRAPGSAPPSRAAGGLSSSDATEATESVDATEPAPEAPQGAADTGGSGTRVDPPLVSCIMPTADRRRFVPRAIRHFLRQDYPARELVVVDDGADPVEDLVPDDPRLRYLRLDGRRSVGAKRNVACDAARGELIAHWDDDDWSAPDRLSLQVEALTRRRADACGLDRLYFFDPARGRAWLYRYGRGRPWLAGGTLCYRRTVWRARPFPDTSHGEDTRFVWGLRESRILSLRDPGFYAALVHPGNTAPKRTDSSRWHPVAPTEIASMLGEDWSFYERLGGGASARENRVPADGAATRVVPDGAPEPGTQGPAAPADRVTVSLPYHRCRAHLREAVESVLVQTHAALRLVVVNDGDEEEPWDLLDDLDDPRLHRFDLDRNRGRYFADAVVLGATDDRYFALQDADDWSRPDRLERLLEVLRRDDADAAFSACRRVRPDGTGRVERFRRLNDPLTAELDHRAHHVGLYRRDALRRVGGTWGGFRVGYDTLVVNFLLMTGRVAYVDEPLYAYRERATSLTRAPATGLRSAGRRRVAGRLRQIYRKALEVHRRREAGSSSVGDVARVIRSQARAGRPDEADRALRSERDRLRRALSGARRLPAAAEGR